MDPERSKTLEHLDSMDHGVVFILGSGKTFKSGTLYSLIDYCPGLRSRKKAFLNFTGLHLFPKDYGYPVEDLDDVKCGSLLIMEDSNRLFDSRSSSKNAVLQKYLPLISHKDILIFLTVQNTSDMDIAFTRSQECLFIHKRMDPYGISNERPNVACQCSIANQVIDDYCSRTGHDYHLVSYVPRFRECLYLSSPPPWYGWEQSHALRDLKILDPKKGAV